MSALRWRRRDFLRSSALGALVAPVAPFWTDLAEAQERKTHMILVFFPNGKCKENVYVSETGNGGWDFGPGFAAYRDLKADAIAFQEYTTEDFCRKHYAGGNLGHHAVALAMFSGEAPAPFQSDNRGRAPTIDRIVAWDYLRRKIATDPVRACLNARMPRVVETLSRGIFFQTPSDYALGKTYTRGLEPTTDIDKPLVAFRQMFGDLAGGSGGSPGSTFDRLWKHGRSMLDAPHSELFAIRGTLPREGRDVLEVHLAKLRELEQSFAAGAAPTTATKAPAAPAELDGRAENWDAIFTQWANLIDASLRADRTRIASFHFGKVAARVRVPSARLPVVTTDVTGDDHHSYSHKGGSGVEVFLKFYSDKVAELVRKLKGGSGVPNILADSVVMVGTEAGYTHAGYQVPVTLFGQGGGTFKTGQLLTFGRGTANYWKHIGTLQAVCHSMGVKSEVIGNPSPEYQKGPWPDLLRNG